MDLIRLMFLKNFLFNLARAVAVLFVVNGLMVVPDALGSLFPSGGAQWVLLTKLFLGIIDSILPLGLLVATLFTVAPMAHFQELSALGACGRSTLQTVWPGLAVAMGAVVFSWVLRYFGVVDLPAGSAAEGLLPAARETAFHVQLAFPLANIYAFFVGVILASAPRRKSLFAGFLGAVVILLFYHLVSSLTLALGRHGFLSPVLAGWGGSLVFSGLIVGWWRRSRL